MPDSTRRRFLTAGAGLMAVAAIPRMAAGQRARTRLILLGTGGGPRPRKASSAAAQVVVSNNVAYVVDCGDGVARQMVLADVPLPTLRHIFLTHLVHSALYVPAVDRLVARVPNATALKASIIAHQTSAEDAGRVAQAAGVKTLVLSHLVPPDEPEVTEQMWIDAARTHFRGPVIIGKDLLEV